MTDDVLQNRYKIQRQLGKRHDQQTLLALDQTSDQLVVVKLLHFNHDLTWDMFKLFEREAKTLESLSHPAIPQYIDYFDVETNFGKGFAFVQSYIEALSLQEHVTAGRTFCEAELKQIAKSVLEILTYLHNRLPPIIHRDIKPSNLLLGDRSGNHVGDVYLVDFGAVQAAVTQGKTRTVVGTYGYMAPEQFGERSVPASDLYGLGATLVYLSSGQHPADLPQKNLRICFEDDVQLSPSFINWLKWMIEPAQEQRLTSADHALQALENNATRKGHLSAPIKPYDSRVMLTKTSKRMRIRVRPKGFSTRLLTPIVAALLMSFMLLLSVIAIPQITNMGAYIYLFFCVWTLACLAGAILLIWDILCTLYGEFYLHLDQNQLLFGYELFGKKIRPGTAPRHKIQKLELTHAKYIPNPRLGAVEIKPQINIWAGTRKLEMFRDGCVSEVELEWLAVELGNWLNLPVTWVL